jgi:phage regulator Rha-like protein
MTVQEYWSTVKNLSCKFDASQKLLDIFVLKVSTLDAIELTKELWEEFDKLQITTAKDFGEYSNFCALNKHYRN